MEAFFGLGEEGFADGFAGGEDGLAFARPVELVSFGLAFDEAVREFLAQEVKVDGRLDLAVFAFGFGQAVGKQPPNGVNGRGCVFGHKRRRLGLAGDGDGQFFHRFENVTDGGKTQFKGFGGESVFVG